MRIRLFSEVALFKYNVSTILSPIVAIKNVKCIFFLTNSSLLVTLYNLFFCYKKSTSMHKNCMIENTRVTNKKMSNFNVICL